MTQAGSGFIGVISDTHDQVGHLVKAIEYFNHKEVDMVVHCGDWVSPFTLIHYAKLKAPLYGVFGNNDGDKYRHIKYAAKFGIDLHLEDGLLTISKYGKEMVVYHGDYPQIVSALIKCGDYDVVFYGHNHLAKVEPVGKVLSINPGTLVDVTNEQVHGASIGLYDSASHEGEILWLEDL